VKTVAAALAELASSARLAAITARFLRFFMVFGDGLVWIVVWISGGSSSTSGSHGRFHPNGICLSGSAWKIFQLSIFNKNLCRSCMKNCTTRLWL
jgi:hypothetical protein